MWKNNTTYFDGFTTIFFQIQVPLEAWKFCCLKQNLGSFEGHTWRIIPLNKYLGSPPYVSHGVRPFGRGNQQPQVLGTKTNKQLSLTNHWFKLDQPDPEGTKRITIYLLTMHPPSTAGWKSLEFLGCQSQQLCMGFWNRESQQHESYGLDGQRGSATDAGRWGYPWDGGPPRSPL